MAHMFLELSIVNHAAFGERNGFDASDQVHVGNAPGKSG